MKVRALLTAAVFVVAGQADAQGLRSPFSSAPPKIRAVGHEACGQTPQAVMKLTGVSFYTDAHRSLVDPALRAANEDLQRPVVAYVRTIATLSDRWRMSEDLAAAECAAAWLDGWARADAFSKTEDVPGGYRRAWYMAGLAIAWLKVRDAPTIDPKVRSHVSGWMGDQARGIIAFYDQPERARDARNNHGDWAALAVAAAAVVTDDLALFDWADRRFRTNLAEITPQGVLPLEAARGRRALHYHLFALTPLTLMSRFEAANGRSGYDAAALDRLEKFTRDAVEDPRLLEPLAGPQEALSPNGDASELVWADVSSQPTGQRLQSLLKAGRPLFDLRTGGDVVATWK